MMRDQKLLYLLADGARARFVERRPATHSFATVDEIDARGRLRGLRANLRARPRPRVVQSGNPDRRHTVGPEDAIQRAKQEFISTVAERASAIMQSGSYDKVVVAAPARLLSGLCRDLESTGAGTIAISRDLTKTPDEALGAWLEPATRRAAVLR